MKELRNILALTLVLGPAAAQAQSMPPEIGRWITESGNLEVDIAPCGAALCATIVRVISSQSMSIATTHTTVTPAPAPASPLGKQILFDLQRVAGGDLQGQIYNRGNNKTYNSLVALAGPNQLKLTIYEDTPAKGKVQLWQRAAR